MFRLNKLFLSVATGMLVTGVYIPVNAKGLEPKKSTAEIEVIEVYAQKRAQNIIDVALAVTVIDGSNIERLQIKDTTQLASLVPNVKMTNNAGEGTPPAFNIRGVGMIDYNTSTVSPIAIYSDSIASGSANNLSINLFDIEEIEVLRGPQGTLFGRNTTGGAVLLMSKQPETVFGGYLNASLGQYHSQSVEGAVNMPLTQSTALRFAFNQDDYDFSTNNLMEGSPDGGLKQQNFRLMLKSEFDNVTILAKLHKENWSGKPKPIASNGILKRDSSGICLPEQLGSNACFDTFGGQVGGSGFWDVKADTADRNHDSDSWGASLNLQWRINQHLDFTIISGLRNLDRDHSWDSDGAGNLIEGTMGTGNRLVSHELNIAYHQKQFFWQTGVFYLTEETKQNNSFDLFRDYRAIPELADYAAEFFYDNFLKNSSTAIYSQLDYQLSDKTTVTTGLRYTDESTRYHANADIDVIEGLIPNIWDHHGKVEDGKWSGKLAITQKLNTHNSIYASYTRGYKSGGYNAGYATNEFQMLDSEYQAEKLNAYEIGSKHQNLISDLQLNIAAFYYDYQDQQVFVNIPDNIVPYHVLKNAGDSTIYGAELEATYTPTHNFQFNLNIGYLPKANIGRYQKNNISVDDNRLPFSSKWNVSGAVVYETQFGGKLLTSQLGFDYQSDFYFDQNENIYTEQKGYTLAYGRISYQATNALLLSVWGKNLTNTEYAELRFDSLAPLAAVTELKGEARQLGVEFSYKF